MTNAPDLLGQALQFRVANEQPIGEFGKDVPGLALQLRLIREEYIEFMEAHAEAVCYPGSDESRQHALKELADLCYVCFQYAASVGWELDEALERIHTSNMSKFPMQKDAGGKVIKGPNYKPPYLEDLV